MSAARVRLESPVHLRVQLAEAQSNLSKSETELAMLPFLLKAAEANLEYTLGSMEGKQSAKGAISDNVIARAKNDHEVAVATCTNLRERGPNLEREVKALRDVVKGLEHQLTLLVEETRQRSEAEAKVQSAEAYRDEAKLQVRQAELALDSVHGSRTNGWSRVTTSRGTWLACHGTGDNGWAEFEHRSGNVRTHRDCKFEPMCVLRMYPW